jgi:hypothetical protein
MFRQAIRKIPGVPSLIKLNTEFEDWWFDWRNGTNTAPDRAAQGEKGWEADITNHTYVPARPKTARRILRALPLENPSDYAFIDFGCGKGRLLLLAMALPFRSITGIELRRELCDQASSNLQTHRKAASRKLSCINIDAQEFEFPKEKMVLYFFNPFGEDVLRTVLKNLGRSLNSCFRDVIVVLDTPIHARIADEMPHLSFVGEGYWYRLYRSRDVRTIKVA